jgi:hypothetical protein
MRVEERVNRTAAGQGTDTRHQRVGTFRRPAIDEQDATRSSLRENVGLSRKTEQKQIVTQLLRDGDIDRCLGGLAPPGSGKGVRPPYEPSGASDGGLQYLSTCVSVPDHHGPR